MVISIRARFVVHTAFFMFFLSHVLGENCVKLHGAFITWIYGSIYFVTMDVQLFDAYLITKLELCHHDHQLINVATARAQAFLMDYT
jgi:hypothetical protein